MVHYKTQWHTTWSSLGQSKVKWGQFKKKLTSSLNRKWLRNKIFVPKFNFLKLWNCGLSDTTEINPILPWFVMSIRLFKLPSFFLFQPIKLTDKGPIRIRYFRSFPESSKGFCCLTSKISQTKDCHYSYVELQKNQYDSYCMSHKNDIISR